MSKTRPSECDDVNQKSARQQKARAAGYRAERSQVGGPIPPLLRGGMKPSMSVLEQILGWKGRLPDFRQHWPNGMNRSMTLSGNSASTKIAVIVPTLSEYSIRLHMVAFSSETRASFGMTVPNVYLNVTVSVPGSDVASCVMCVRPQHQHRSAREPQGSRSERTRERERERTREGENERERERERTRERQERESGNKDEHRRRGNFK